MPVTIRVGTAAGDVVQHATLSTREQTIAIPGIATAPTMVVFDDGNTVLKTLSFDQPTAWLATQLARDPDVWNRFWVIGQLAHLPGDSTAGAALARAATTADYQATRAEAAEALGGFPAATALPPLEAALRDTSATVRQSALEALGELGGARAIALATAALTGDSSYEVRAAAVGALARADSVHRRAVIAAALGTPSYQDAIRTAALRGIVLLNDTSFVAPVEGLLGLYRNPAHALAQLANHGSPAALDALMRHLDDERPYVRRWVLEAFRVSVSPDLGLPRLRAVLSTLRYPDTRKRASALVEQLEQRKPGM
jgi:HEAT repeat protein